MVLERSMSLMEYIPTGQGLSPSDDPRLAAVHGAGKYVGAVAAGYDAKRETDPKWLLEQRLIEDMLSDLPPGSIVLDVPCGTGRFFDFYKSRGFAVRGVDLSSDMLQQAVIKLQAGPVWDVELRQGDVRIMPVTDKACDAAVMCRLTRWLSPQDCQQALRELQRVTKGRIIFTARVANHPHARSVELFEAALDGWKITRNEAGVDLDYRVIELRPSTA
jgi:ubiquinone/menaquinone biosynthesis C-methylase UbiE